MAGSSTTLEIVAKMRDEASGKMRQLAQETENAEQSTLGLGSAMRGALGAISAYAGFSGLGQLMNAYQESNLQLAQARFYLAGYSKDVKGNFDVLTKWGAEQQKLLGVGDEYATLVAARLLPRLKDMSKSQEYANILLRGQRIGMLDASEAANMLMRATDGNERALRFLLEQWGIAAPEFVSMQTLFEELRKRIEAAEDGLSPFARQWGVLKETWGDFMENAGLPLITWASTALGWINQLIERFPWLGKVISAAMIIIAGVLAAAGVAMMVQFAMPVLAMLGRLGLAFLPLLMNPWVLGIAALLLAVYLIYTHWDKVKELIFAVWGAIKYTWDATVDWLSDKMLAFAQSMTAAWTAFKNFWIDLWNGIKAAIQSAWDYISNIVSSIVGAVNSAISAISSLASKAAGGISGFVGAAVGAVAGKRASGGPVSGGLPYLVGENGPELFIPNSSGRISNSPAGGGASIMIDMRGSTFLSRDAAVDVGDLIIRRLREIYRIGL